MALVKEGKEKLMEIVWEDACGGDGWISRDFVCDIKPILIKTVGYLLKKDDKGYTLTQSLNKEDGSRDVGAYMIIPIDMVKKKRWL